MTERSTPPPSETERALEEASSLASESPAAAIEVLRAVFRAQPEHPEATRLLATCLERQGHPDWQAKAGVLSKALQSPELLKAARLITESKLDKAEAILRPYLAAHPEDPGAHRLLADLAMRLNRSDDGEALLRKAVEIAPCYVTARFELAHLLYRQDRFEAALEQLDLLLDAPQDLRFLNLKAISLNRIGRVEEAIATYEAVLRHHPDDSETWTHYGHSLRSIGRQQESIAAYRKALSIDPALGAAWWSLANLKTLRLDAEDIDQMLAVLARDDLNVDTRIHVHFALGKAIEDAGAYREAFGHYLEGNSLRRTEAKYDPEWLSTQVQVAGEQCDRSFFEARRGWGLDTDAPIFIVGMPRAGSTLTEQILASHPEIEGLSELHYLPGLVRHLASSSGQDYPNCLSALDAHGARSFAEKYLALSAAHRKSGQPHFVDKNPNNWVFVDFIHLIFPNAKMIDVRRNPLSYGVANFRQYYAQGHNFSYSFDHLGRYYRNYVRMIERFETAAPGRICRVIYEELVTRTEDEVRRILAFLDLPFNDDCLRFYENDRTIRTPSSEQVRQPINQDGLHSWKKYEPWLEPLKDSLGSVLDTYPAVPADLKSSIRGG